MRKKKKKKWASSQESMVLLTALLGFFLLLSLDISFFVSSYSLIFSGAKDWMFEPPQNFYWNSDSLYGGIGRWGLGRWLGCVGGVPVNGISALVNEGDLAELLVPSALWRHSKKLTVYEPGSRHLPDSKSTSILIWTFQTPEINNLQAIQSLV